MARYALSGVGPGTASYPVRAREAGAASNGGDMHRIALIALLASTAAAQGPELSGDDAELALALARVAANEASLAGIHPADVEQIWQIAEGHGATSAERLRWLRLHCGCVLADVAPEQRPPRARPPRGSNCWWSWHLPAEGLDKPVGWDDRVPWSTVGSRSWERVRAAARAHVAGTSRARPPCRVRPTTWGGPRWDQEHAAAAGLTVVECVGTHNLFYESLRRRLARERLRVSTRALLSERTPTVPSRNGSVPTQDPP